jgi:hypothetical protein
MMDGVNTYIHIVASKKLDLRYINLFIGTALFCLSDRLIIKGALAGTYFVNPVLSGIVVMVFYYDGQHLISLYISQISIDQKELETSKSIKNN